MPEPATPMLRVSGIGRGEVVAVDLAPISLSAMVGRGEFMDIHEAWVKGKSVSEIQSDLVLGVGLQSANSWNCYRRPTSMSARPWARIFKFACDSHWL